MNTSKTSTVFSRPTGIYLGRRQLPLKLPDKPVIIAAALQIGNGFSEFGKLVLCVLALQNSGLREKEREREREEDGEQRVEESINS